MRRRRYRFHAPAKTERSVLVLHTRAEAALKLVPRRESGDLGAREKPKRGPDSGRSNADATATS